MDDLYLDFRDALIELVDKDSNLDYTPVREDEGFITLDELACHYLHQEDEEHKTISIYFLNPTETIREKHGSPELVYCLDGANWTAVPSGKHPNVSSKELANMCIESLIKMNNRV
jgi:hypothetical protein